MKYAMVPAFFRQSIETEKYSFKTKTVLLTLMDTYVENTDGIAEYKIKGFQITWSTIIWMAA